MTLDLGDMTLELYFAGGTHTASDIWIFVPEEGLLFTGDTMADVWLTDTPGCLRAFMMRQGVERNMPLMLSHWKSLIDRKDEIKDLIPGHWNGDLTFDGFVNRYNYAKTMYEGITTGANNGEKLEEQFRAFALQTRFPELVGSPGIEQFTHYGSILALWSDATGAVSAATALGDMVEEMGIDKAVDKIRAAHVNESRDYFFLEADINQLGYRFMNQELMPEAIAVFKLNVEFFPESWNVYDSLAEACVKSGDTDKAIKLYNKSLELNPDNENGKQMLARIKSQN
jgi:pentatricopeptide repeat protein